MLKKPTTKEQIESLLRFEAYKLVEKYIPKENWGLNDNYKEIFTVTRDEILNYIKNNYKLKDLMLTKPSDKDGFYAIPTNQNYFVYDQERGYKWINKHVNNENEVWEIFLDEYVIHRSGTGLTFK